MITARIGRNMAFLAGSTKDSIPSAISGPARARSAGEVGADAVDAAGVSPAALLLACPSHPITVAKTKAAAESSTARLPVTGGIVDSMAAGCRPSRAWLNCGGAGWTRLGRAVGRHPSDADGRPVLPPDQGMGRRQRRAGDLRQTRERNHRSPRHIWPVAG